MSRIVVLGGTGFIGRALCAALRAAGREVVVVSRRPTQENGRAQWDGKSAAGWGHWVDGAYGVVNLAGEGIARGRWTRERKARILESRLNAGRAVCEAVTRAEVKPEVLLQASAVGWYGPCGDETLREEAPAGKGFLADVARQWEASTAGVESVGVRRIIARTGVVLGGSGGALAKMALPFRLFLGGPVGSGRQWVSWIHLHDEVGAMLHLLRDPAASGPYNLVAPGSLTNADFSRAVGKALRRPSWLPAPGFAMKALLGEMAQELLLSGQRAVPERLLASGYVFRFQEIGAALAEAFGAARG